MPAAAAAAAACREQTAAVAPIGLLGTDQENKCVVVGLAGAVDSVMLSSMQNHQSTQHAG